MPLRAIRRRLRLIRYYSAVRPRRPWNRVFDLAMAAALIAAWPVTWTLDRTWIVRSNAVTVSGFLYREPDDRIVAATTTIDPIDGRPSDAQFCGSYQVDLTDEEHGWPFVTSRGFRTGTINVQLVDEHASLGAADLPAGTPFRSAIEHELAATGQGAAAAVLWGGAGEGAPVVRRYGAWLANGIVWSLALVIASQPLVGAARIATAIVTVRRGTRERRRVQDGRCAGCGYDLRGSTFGERCPECGALL